jgi:hypothetical protein
MVGAEYVVEVPGLKSELADLLRSYITEQRWISILRELVPAGQPASENPLDPDMPPGREEGIARVVAARLADYGLEIETPTKREGRPNVIGTLKGSDANPKVLILNDHLDTYPAGDPTQWTKTGGEPYRATRDGDFVYARGTSDTRGNLACTLLAVEALQRAGIKLRGTVKCVYTVDEEKDGPDGSIFLLDEYGLRCDRWQLGHGHRSRQFRSFPDRDRNTGLEDAYLAPGHRRERGLRNGRVDLGAGNNGVHIHAGKTAGRHSAFADAGSHRRRRAR